MTSLDPSTALFAHTLEHAQHYLANLPHASLDATADLEAMRVSSCRAFPEEGHGIK